MSARQKLIDAAFGFFLAHGYDGTGIAQILKATGLSKGGFYHYFDSKLDLLNAVVEYYLPVPFGSTDWVRQRALSAAEQEAVIASEYAKLDDAFASMGGQIMRYFAFFFDALSQLDGYRSAVDAAYAQAIDSLATAHAREGTAAATARARAFLASLEGEIYLRAVTTSKQGAQ